VGSCCSRKGDQLLKEIGAASALGGLARVVDDRLRAQLLTVGGHAYPGAQLFGQIAQGNAVPEALVPGTVVGRFPWPGEVRA
jgi:hypothetical protein